VTGKNRETTYISACGSFIFRGRRGFFLCQELHRANVCTSGADVRASSTCRIHLAYCPWERIGASLVMIRFPNIPPLIRQTENFVFAKLVAQAIVRPAHYTTLAFTTKIRVCPNLRPLAATVLHKPAHTQEHQGHKPLRREGEDVPRRVCQTWLPRIANLPDEVSLLMVTHEGGLRDCTRSSVPCTSFLSVSSLI
jgi:hypothetical protein